MTVSRFTADAVLVEAGGVRNPPSCGNQTFETASLLLDGRNGDWIMTEARRGDAARRNRLLEAAQQELTKFERTENEYSKKDRQERATELRLPLNTFSVR
jgi:hypothetical protein